MDKVSFGSTDFGVAACSKTDIVTPGAGIHLWFFGMLVTIKALGNGTRGAYTTMEVMVHPGYESYKHLQLNEVETLLVLEGELIVHLKDKEFHAKKGAFVHIPKLVPHKFINKFDKPAKLLISYAPAGIDDWYLKMGRPVDSQRSRPIYTEDEIKGIIHRANDYGIVFADRIEEPPLKLYTGMSCAAYSYR